MFWNYVAETVVAASETGTATINGPNSTITIASRTISSTNCGTDCGSGSNLTASPYPQVDVNTEYWWSTVIEDSGGLSDVASVVMSAYKTGNATKGAFDEQRSYQFEWVNFNQIGPSAIVCEDENGCWYELDAGGWAQVTATGTYLIATDSSHSDASNTTALTSGTWTFASKLSKLAQYTQSGSSPTDWFFTVDANSKSPGLPDLRSGFLDVNLYISISVPSSIAFGTVTAGAANASAPSNPYVDTYTANAILQLQLSGGGDPTNEYGNSFPLSNIYVSQTSSASNNDGVELSTSPQSLYSNLTVASSQNVNTYWFVTTPDPFPPGAYTFGYTVSVAFRDWAT